MEKAVSGDLLNFVERRLHPVRLSISHLNRTLEGTRSGTMVSINRDLLHSIASTLEIFLEDFETHVPRPSGSSDDRKGASDKAGDSPRVTQTRVS